MHPKRFQGLRSVRCAQKELPVDVKTVIYERVLRFASPVLPLLAQDCCISSHDGADARSSNMTNRGI
jgi:hypothetical protein